MPSLHLLRLPLRARARLLLVCVCTGMCCLSMLDTPTRFEKPKEGMRND